MNTSINFREFLEYDQEIGIFRWIVYRNYRSKIGDIAGSNDKFGYNIIRINGKSYKAHRLAWLYVYGQFPEKSIDHINGIKSDNRISNLREVTNSENQMNRLSPKHNTSGCKGVGWDITHNKWVVRIQKDKIRITIGRFSIIEDAINAYKNAERYYFGEYARFK